MQWHVHVKNCGETFIKLIQFRFHADFFFWRNINWLNFNFMQIYFYPRNLFIIIRCNRAFWAEIDWEKKNERKKEWERRNSIVHEWNSYQWWRHLMKWPADQVHGKLPNKHLVRQLRTTIRVIERGISRVYLLEKALCLHRKQEVAVYDVIWWELRFDWIVQRLSLTPTCLI